MLKSLIKFLGICFLPYLYGFSLRTINQIKCDKIGPFKLDPNILKSIITIFTFGFWSYLYGLFFNL